MRRAGVRLRGLSGQALRSKDAFVTIGDPNGN